VRASRSGGGLCYGYDVVPGEERGGRTINADEAAIVRRIYTELAAGRSAKSIARRLNDDGIPGPRGIRCAADGSFFEGFRMPALRDVAACAGAGVRKPRVKEPTGAGRGLWGFRDRRGALCVG
jgi:hypothetical protein